MSRLGILFSYIKYSIRVFKQLKKGQKINYDLLQLSHRLEKGLTMSNPKPLWGWDKAYRMASLIKNNKDDFSNRTASAVLSAYIVSKKHSDNPEDVHRAQDFTSATGFSIIDYHDLGGTQIIKSLGFNNNELDVIERLFITRHSAREFSKKSVSHDIIYKAVNMAQRCPSACNRQPYKCYVIDSDQRRKYLPSYADYDADKYLIITGDIRAFVNTELYDWIVSPVIFAAYLTLSLHALGVGSCVLKKQLVTETTYSVNFRKISGIDESEIIVLELAIGYYKENYIAPVSLRASAEDIVKFIP